MNKQADRQERIDTQTDRQMNKQTDRQERTDTQTDR